MASGQARTTPEKYRATRTSDTPQPLSLSPRERGKRLGATAPSCVAPSLLALAAAPRNGCLRRAGSLPAHRRRAPGPAVSRPPDPSPSRHWLETVTGLLDRMVQTPGSSFRVGSLALHLPPPAQPTAPGPAQSPSR